MGTKLKWEDGVANLCNCKLRISWAGHYYGVDGDKRACLKIKDKNGRVVFFKTLKNHKEAAKEAEKFMDKYSKESEKQEKLKNELRKSRRKMRDLENAGYFENAGYWR